MVTVIGHVTILCDFILHTEIIIKVNPPDKMRLLIGMAIYADFNVFEDFQ